MEGVTIHRNVLPTDVLPPLWDYLQALSFTRIERGAMHLSRALQDDNTHNEKAHLLVRLLKLHRLDAYMPFDDVSVVRYDSGADYVDWHSDGGPLLEPGCAMGIVSLGQSRPIEFRRKDDEANVYRVTLQENDLVVSRAGFQRDHQHRIPPHANADGLRISIVLFTHATR
jgi:alkylated DNA repair dioxygenase AlkB